MYIKKLLSLHVLFNINKYWLYSLHKYFNYNQSFIFIYKNNYIQSKNNFISFINLFQIYFFKKEIFYTKLKYSRVPQFDVSATGIASFLSAAVGVLICEKTGFELLDGGDFLYLIGYIVILYWSLSHFIHLLNSTTFIFSFWYIFSLSFYKNLN
jgi:hypothetical protein